jgi:hypothetical protein
MIGPLFPVIELIDRLSIARIKHEITNGANQEELDWYENQASQFDLFVVAQEIEKLSQIHRQIWQLESDLKSFKEHNHTLEEIGRRAILIRDHNHRRISIKNIIAEKLGCSVKEIKKDHASE